MQWIADSWFLILLGGGMFALHLFAHGGHGTHHRMANEDDETGLRNKELAANMAPNLAPERIVTVELIVSKMKHKSIWKK